jgi:hypothetical protein
MSRTGSQPVSFQWHEQEPANLGEGISRPMRGAASKPFDLLVKPLKAMPMKVTLMAETKAAAFRYAVARWPGAEVSLRSAQR